VYTRQDGFDTGKPGKKGQPGVRGVPGIRGSPGYFSVRFYSLRGATAARSTPAARSLPDSNGEFSFRLDSATVDLRTGTVSVAADTDDVVQNLCLAFSVAVLYVLCQPRPVRTGADGDGAGPGAAAAAESKGGEAMSPRAAQKVETESLGLVVAAGYLYDTPCNSYIKCSVFAGGRRRPGGGGAAQRVETNAEVARTAADSRHSANSRLTFLARLACVKTILSRIHTPV